MIHHVTCLLLCVAALRASAGEDPLADLKQGQPKEVAELIERVVGCNHWSGEEPYDAERKKEISSALAELKCNRLASDESRAAKKYAKNSKALKAVKEARLRSY